MNFTIKLSVLALACASLGTGAFAQDAKKADAKQDAKKADARKGGQKSTSFFVTSEGSGKGADLGGLEGADKLCQARAEAAGAGKRTWRAYLSSNGDGKTVNARDRIGRGPWYNVKGELIARNVDQLHVDNNINKQTALDEKGNVVNGVGDKPTRHDILTGSDTYGMAFPGKEDTTCGNWTKSSSDGSAQLGHHDRRGLRDDPPSKSWNNSHPSRGCSQENLRSTGGDGLLYCFAAK
jgi:hypothetical protein